MTIRRRGVRQSPLFSKKEKWLAFGAVAFWLGLLLVFVHYNLNVFRPKEIVVGIVAKEKSGFKTSIGNKIEGWATNRAYAGEVVILPTPGCTDMLVVEYKQRMRNPFQLQHELEGVEGVETVKIFPPYKLTIHRPCGENQKSLWQWQEVWQGVVPILERSLKQESAK